MTKYILLSLSIFGIFLLGCNSTQKETQETPLADSYTIGFYNVENLFDTIDNPDKYDESFTPQGKKEWSSKRYEDKLQKLSKVIEAVGIDQLPWGMGLCEVENKAVVTDLINTGALKGKYSLVHFESPDERGIDVAFIYLEDKLNILHSEAIQTPFDFDLEDKTRDILYLKVGFDNMDGEMHLFYNHWPSRSGGMEKSEPKRMAVAAFLKAKMDSIQAADPKAKIVSMGDYNDEPNNRSVAEVLGAKALDGTAEPKALYNLSYAQFSEGKGSYHYWREKKWNMIDQAIVNGNFFAENSNPMLEEFTMYIYKQDWILHKNDDGTMVPNKTYGKGYYGGYSDHLPIYLRFKVVQ